MLTARKCNSNLSQLSIMANQHHSSSLHSLYKNLIHFQLFPICQRTYAHKLAMGLFENLLHIKNEGVGRMLDRNISLWFVALGKYQRKQLYFATGLYRSFCHRSFGFNIITIFQNYGGAKRNRTADLCKPPCSALPLS